LAAVGLLIFGFVAPGARAQLIIERTVAVNQTIADRGQYVSTLVWTNAGVSSISQVQLQLTLSSPSPSNPMWLGDMYASLTHGTASETERMAQVFDYFSTDPDNSATSLSATYNLGLSGSWLASNTWSLLVADRAQGGVARLDSWKLTVEGAAATNGIFRPGANGRLAVSAGESTAQVGAAVELEGGSKVTAEAAAGRTLRLEGGLTGAGDLETTTESGGKVVVGGNSADFSGILKVAGSGTTELTDSRALGTGQLRQTNGNSTVRLNFAGTLSNPVSVYKVAFATNGATLAGTTTVNNAEFDVASGDTNTISGEVVGGGTVTKLGGGTLVLSGTNNSYTNITDIRNGTLRAVTVADTSNNSSIGAGPGLTIGSSSNAGTFVHTGSNLTNSMNREVLVGSSGGTFAVEHSNSRVTLTGNVTNQTTNAATLTKSGAGTLAFGSGANVSVSTIAVQQGTLLLGAANTIGNSTAINLAGGEFKAGGYEDTVGRLSVSVNSIFDFGTAGGSATTFTFADFDTAGYGGAILTINNAAVGSSFVFNYNYNGDGVFSGGANSFANKIQFGGAGQFGQISFGGGAGALGTTTLLVAIPDARIAWAAGFLCGLIGLVELRRRRPRSARPV
jgi:autotransporter-associated beta strand protein